MRKTFTTPTDPGALIVRMRKLDASMPVTLVNSNAGWTLVARETKILGYVPTKDLLPLR